jgi:hypothetical protein
MHTVILPHTVKSGVGPGQGHGATSLPHWAVLAAQELPAPGLCSPTAVRDAVLPPQATVGCLVPVFPAVCRFHMEPLP